MENNETKDLEEIIKKHQNDFNTKGIYEAIENCGKEAYEFGLSVREKELQDRNTSIERINNVLGGAMIIIRKLTPRNKQLYATLKELVRLQDMKHTWGETPQYLNDAPKAWDTSKKVLEAKFVSSDKTDNNE